MKFGWNWDIWLILWNLADIMKFGWYCEIWLILWNFAGIARFGWNCELWSKLWYCEIWLKLWIPNHPVSYWTIWVSYRTVKNTQTNLMGWDLSIIYLRTLGHLDHCSQSSANNHFVWPCVLYTCTVQYVVQLHNIHYISNMSLYVFDIWWMGWNMLL